MRHFHAHQPTAAAAPVRRHTKSRSGCAECKARRVKCGEAKPKPGCGPCRKKKVTCPGYARELQWLAQFSQPSQDEVVASVSVERPPTSPSARLHASLSILPFGPPSPPRHKPAWAIPPDISPRSTTYLVDYYFGHICGLLSSFDGAKNPFRTTLLGNWHKSPLIHASIQTLSAADLAKSGIVSMHDASKANKEAFRQLALKLKSPDMKNKASIEEALLALLLIGPISSWFDPDDFRAAHYRMASSLLTQKRTHETQTSSTRLDLSDRFFSESLVYWWMLLSFAPPIDDIPPPDPQSPGNTTQSPIGPKRYPHPWTGASADSRLLFGKVARLVFLQRNRRRQSKFLSRTQLLDDEHDLRLAGDLKQDILSLSIPQETELSDPEDPDVSTSDFVNVAESFKFCGLFLLYRAFPDLLDIRLNVHFDFLLSQEQATENDEKRQQWLTSSALRTLELLESTCKPYRLQAIQSILLIVIASELYFPTVDEDISEACEQTDASLLEYLKHLNRFNDGSENDAVEPLSRAHQEVEMAREQVWRRVELCATALPRLTMERLDNIIREIYKQMDAGLKVFWMDVMIENQWVGVFG